MSAHILVVGIDGVRLDTARAAHTPHLDAVVRDGWPAEFELSTDAPTLSGPTWAVGGDSRWKRTAWLAACGAGIGATPPADVSHVSVAPTVLGQPLIGESHLAGTSLIAERLPSADQNTAARQKTAAAFAAESAVTA
ncbi:hypothetical protein Cme02nite_45730 [Catellatospora methionotrophica]|uniref:Uncharacterized protein n=1 Tax=Catellatospora methionotrophica TaxID=121620 RepID=A0A8J3PIC1_9ACTN|nr:hypothetical protein [Catellatospora methionotrophica]GIG16241.1 hypothetical protein Cme02nite_45730 [Catellatospora methionotrophica]